MKNIFLIDSIASTTSQRVRVYGYFLEQATSYRKAVCWYHVKRHITLNYSIRYSAVNPPVSPYLVHSQIFGYTAFKYSIKRKIAFDFTLPYGVTAPDYHIYEISGTVGIPATSINLNNLQ